MRNRNFLRFVICFLVLVSSGCATFGPPGASGPMAVNSGAVENTDPFVIRPISNTFYVKSTDLTNVANFGTDVAQALQRKGMTLVDQPEKAAYFIDIQTENHIDGRGQAPVAGKAVGAVGGVALGAALADSGAHPVVSAFAGLAGLMAGAIADEANTPSFCYLEVSLVVDELRPDDTNKGKPKGKKGSPAKKESIVYETTIRNVGQYYQHQCSELDALSVVKANITKAIADTFLAR